MGNTDVFPEKCPKQAFSQRYIPDRWASIHMSLCPAAPPPPPPRAMCFNMCSGLFFI